jgi:hypothetical protein
MPVTALVACMLVYGIAVILMFRKDSRGLRRRWLPLDYIWVPLGGLTVLSLVMLWWRMQ